MNMTQNSCSKSMLLLCCSGSIILNLFLISYYLLVIQSRNLELSWSLNAAREAEKVAKIECSGHGRVYLDDLMVDGKLVCECNACFEGHDCSIPTHNCVVDADSGNPIFLEPFWKQHAASSAIVVSGWHRMGYEYKDNSLISNELEGKIRQLHDIVGNAVTKDRYIIFGIGSTQLLNAAVHALSSQSSNSLSPTAKVVASAPYYPVYKSQTELFESKRYIFEGDVFSWNSSSTSSKHNFIELVTSPNNPDGTLKNAVLMDTNNVQKIHDLAYYWPHYTPIPSPVDEDVMLFTLSKLTGHAGSRFGWAIIKDQSIYERMLEYIDLNTYGVPRETQLRTSKLLKVVLDEGNGSKMFEFGNEQMKNRWHKLRKAFSISKRFILQDISPLYCTFWEKVNTPSPAFAWIKCLDKDDEDCSKVLKKDNIIGRPGCNFGVENRYVRLSIVKSKDDFDLLLERIVSLVSQEKHLDSA